MLIYLCAPPDEALVQFFDFTWDMNEERTPLVILSKAEIQRVLLRQALRNSPRPLRLPKLTHSIKQHQFTSRIVGHDAAYYENKG